MRVPRLLAASVAISLVITASPLPGRSLAALSAAAPVPNDAQAVLHALNRLTFGPRPDDVARVREVGLSTWIDRQLRPADLDDSRTEALLPKPLERGDLVDSPKEARRVGRQSVEALAVEKITRALLSERQLQEVLVDFWFNHFNVFAGKGRTSLYVPAYEREAIRPHVLGRFRDLLGATAKSPAMLFYLDNWLSADPKAAARVAALRALRPPRAMPRSPEAGASTPEPSPKAAKRQGLNENYARELLELHTLGVDGGYTQQDIIDVARAFTGWSIQPPRTLAGRASADNEMGTFRFTPLLHDTGEKQVLGHPIKGGGGVDDGERVLDLLARHPSTARHIARRLAQRFVSDTPPEALVTRAARRFQDTNGDLREVVRAIVTSPEFFAADVRRVKVKTPLEFVTSALRATGQPPPPADLVLRMLQQLGMPLYMCQPPTGYDDLADTWSSAGALVARANIAPQLAGARAAMVSAPDFQRR